MEGEDRYTDKIVLACDRDKEATILKEVIDYEKSARDGVRENDFYSFWGGVPTKDGIAMLSVNDTLFRRMYKQLSALVEQLEADDSVKGILFTVDSPGGMFSGAIPCAEMLATQISKPHAVYVGGLACSAAYLLSSAIAVGGRLFADKSSIIGSIGVEVSYLDMSGMLGKMGITRRVFHSAHAGKKNLSPETDEGKANLQKELDEDEDLFIDCIARYRGTSKDGVYEKFGQGLTFHAAEALERGMVDQVCDGIEDAFDYIRASVEDGGEEELMDLKDMKTEDFQTALQARPDLKASIVQEAVQAERARVATLASYKSLAQCAGAETVIENAIRDGQSPEEALKGIIAENNHAKELAEKAKKDASASLSRSAAAAVANTPVVSPISQPKTEADIIHEGMSAFFKKKEEN